LLGAGGRYLQREIAAQFGIGVRQVGVIATGRAWSHLPGTAESPIHTPVRWEG
jgi:hypothetical protein